MTNKHASFWDVVDGYERKDAQDKMRLAALEGLCIATCMGLPPAIAAGRWIGMAGLFSRPATQGLFYGIAEALENVALTAPGILSFPVSDADLGGDRRTQGNP